MISRVLFIFLTVLFIQVDSIADINMFLFQNVEINKIEDDLALTDIARFDGNYSSTSKFCDIKIDKELYSDGYIDRKELSDLLRKNVDDLFFIYGSAIKVIEKNDDSDMHIEEDNYYFGEEYLVKRGDRVNLVVTKRGIKVELKGSVMEDGKKGDEITVRMKSFPGKRSKSVRGIVRSKGLVEVVL